MTKILDFGKNKGKILAECGEKYLKWLATHEQVWANMRRLEPLPEQVVG